MKTFRLATMMLIWPILGHAETRAAERPDIWPAKVVADLREDDARGNWQYGLWDYAAVDPSTRRLLVGRMSAVQTVHLTNETFGPMLAPGQHVHAVLPLPGNRVLYTNGDSNTAAVVDGSGAVLATLPTGRKPDGAIYDPSLGDVLVMNGTDGTVTRIDDRSADPKVAGTIVVGGKLEAPAVDGDGHLFVNVEDRNALAIVSLEGAGRLVRQVPLPGCEAPSGLAFDPDSALLVSACENGVALVLDKEGTVKARLPIGPHPDAAIADPAHHRVFVPSGGDGTVSEIVLDGTPHVGRVWRTRDGARTGAYDPATERLYLPYGAVIRTPGQASRLAPGSFGILVMDVR